MLVLSRGVDEAIRIGDDVRVVVVRGSRGDLKIGIEAPTSVAILREEIYLERERNEGGGQGTPAGGMEAPPPLFPIGESSFNN